MCKLRIGIILAVTTMVACLSIAELQNGLSFGKSGQEKMTTATSKVDKNKALIARTLHFISQGQSPTAAADLLEWLPHQRDEFARLKKQLEELNKKIEAGEVEMLQQIEKELGRKLTPEKRKYFIDAYRKKAELEFAPQIARTMLDFQAEQILSWHPDMIGAAKTLTETPIGDALGLTEKQKDKLRQEADKIGARLWKEYYRSRREASKLFEEVLTAEQRARVNELYYGSLSFTGTPSRTLSTVHLESTES